MALKNSCVTYLFKIVLEICLIGLLLGSSANAATITVNATGGGMFRGIQDAIDNASEGDIILVDSGSYQENVNVSKSLVLKGNGKIKPVIDAGGIDNAIILRAGNSTIEGFAATNGNENASKAGIFVLSKNNRILNNDLYNNSQGIYLQDSDCNTLMGNNASGNSFYGIDLERSGCNVLKDNIMTGNKNNFRLSGNEEEHFDNQIDISNLVNHKPIYYTKNAKNTVYDTLINAGTFFCISCINITIKDMSLESNAYGVFLWNTSFGRIENISVSNNGNGISLLNSSNITLSKNNATGNYNGINMEFSDGNNSLTGNNATGNYNGFYLYFSGNNTLFDNMVLNNTGYGILTAGSNYNDFMNNNVSDNNGYGIYLGGSSENILSNNTASKNRVGIILDSSSNNMIKSNNALNNEDNGIYLGYSIGNTVFSNNASDNENGIYLWYSGSNDLKNNIIRKNKYNFGLSGNEPSQYDNDIDLTNLADDMPIYYIKNVKNISFDSSLNAGTLYCISCENVTIKNMSFSGNINGISLWNTTYSKILNVNITNNYNGIFLGSSGNNTISGSHITDNRNGISLEWMSSGNIIYNNYLDNNLNAIDEGRNRWNITNIRGENIIGGSSLGGNVWIKSDNLGFSQNCTDTDNDGICDSSYQINPNSTDMLPLVYSLPSDPDVINAIREIEKVSLEKGESTNITIQINSNVVQSLVLQENIPAGWSFTRVSDDADEFKNTTNEWVWSNVTPGNTRTVIYSITAPAGALPGTYNVTGTITSSNVMVTVAGGNIIVFNILAHYRNLGIDPDKVETTDLLKAMDDWNHGTAPSGFAYPITKMELNELINEWTFGQ